MEARADAGYRDEVRRLATDFCGRPTPLYHAERLSEAAGRPVWLKREDLMHTGSHKLNNALGQCLLAKRMGKPRIIAETGRRPARRRDRHRLRAARAGVRRLHGHGGHAPPDAQRPAHAPARRDRRAAWTPARARSRRPSRPRSATGWPTWATRTTRSARASARRRSRRSCATCSGSSATRRARRSSSAPGGSRSGSSPASAAAPTRSARSSRSSTTPRWSSSASRRRGRGSPSGRHGAPLTVGGRGGVLHGSYSAIMQDEEGQITEAHSISAGLDYPGCGPEHAWLRDSGRARYVAVTDGQARRRVPPARRARGHHPGARVLPRGRLGALRAAARRRRARSRVPVRPRRQGPRRGAGEGRMSTATTGQRRRSPPRSRRAASARR